MTSPADAEKIALTKLAHDMADERETLRAAVQHYKASSEANLLDNDRLQTEYALLRSRMDATAQQQSQQHHD